MLNEIYTTWGQLGAHAGHDMEAIILSMLATNVKWFLFLLGDSAMAITISLMATTEESSKGSVKCSAVLLHPCM